MIEEEFKVFKKKVASLIKLDLTNYKHFQMERRILSLMRRHNISNLNDYYKVLESEQTKLEEFINMLTINVSEFFGNPDKFNELESKYLSNMLEEKSTISIWSAGCSIGAEIYSIAMILDSKNMLGSCKLIASDFDKAILDKAQSGVYTKNEISTLPEKYKHYFKQFDASGETYKLSTKITSSVKFEQMDLLNSSFERGFDLILCRNVVIYFTEEAKDNLYRKFYDALNPKGVLFIGSTEHIHNHKDMGYELQTPFFYQKN